MLRLIYKVIVTVSLVILTGCETVDRNKETICIKGVVQRQISRTPVSGITVSLFREPNRWFTLVPKPDEHLANTRTNNLGEFVFKGSRAEYRGDLMISVNSGFHVYRAADGTWIHTGSGAKLNHPSKTAPNILLIPEKNVK